LFDYKEIREERLLPEKAYFYQSIIHKKETTTFELRAIIVLVAGVRGTRQTKTSLPELQCKLRGR
jgi:hypothetical protein